MSVWHQYMPLRGVVALVACLFTTCVSPQGTRRPAGNDPERPGTVGALASPGTEHARCLESRKALEREPALPGVPELEAARPEIVARARAAEVLFLERPEPEPQPVPSRIALLRQQLHQARIPWTVLRRVYADYRRDRSALRQVVLTDGYLYADRTEVATLLGNHVTLSHLFDAQDVVVTRGSRVLHARKKGLEYYWRDGPEVGSLARLWLFDRAANVGEPLGEPKHLSLENIREQTGADRIEIERLTPKGVLAQLVYDDIHAPSVLAIRNGTLELECEAVDPSLVQRVLSVRALAARRVKVMTQLRQTIAEQVADRLPFDEPKTEEGQQDGKLRQEWRDAYMSGRYKFTFNGDEYSVFGNNGQPRIPQVCADFVVDTWERLAGTRWRGSRERRERQVGRIDFNALNIENRRSVDRLIDFARNKPEWFDVLEYSDAERVPFSDRKRFFARLFEQRRHFQPGDVVAILGLRDDDLMHYHSFIIVADDPLTGMPTTVAANAGRPRIRSWEAEMQNAPKRSIVARIRPRLTWLEALADTDGRGPADLSASAEQEASAAPAPVSDALQP